MKYFSDLVVYFSGLGVLFGMLVRGDSGEFYHDFMVVLFFKF